MSVRVRRPYTPGTWNGISVHLFLRTVLAHIIPFRGTLYDPATVGDVRKVVAPPYDIIDAAMQQSLHDRHPQNVIRLELGFEQAGDGPSSNKYTRASAALRNWLRSGALHRDTQSAIYYHTIEYLPPYSSPGSATRLLKGFLATVELEEFGTGKIYPHENTRAAAKTDRLNLLEACRSNFSPDFSLYSDPTGSILAWLEQATASDKPRIDFRDDVGFRQRLWAVTNSVVLEKVVDAMKSTPLFIADSHLAMKPRSITAARDANRQDPARNTPCNPTTAS